VKFLIQQDQEQAAKLDLLIFTGFLPLIGSMHQFVLSNAANKEKLL